MRDRARSATFPENSGRLLLKPSTKLQRHHQLPLEVETEASSKHSVNPPQSPTPDLKAQSCQDASEPPIDFLNAAITHEDITAALKRLKRNKAAGESID